MNILFTKELHRDIEQTALRPLRFPPGNCADEFLR